MDESPSRGASGAKRTIGILLGAAVVAGAVFFVGRALRSGSEAPGSTKGPHFRNTDPAVAYIGSDACAECHETEHTSFHATRHARSFGPVDSSTQDLPAKLHHATSGLDYEIRREGGVLRMRESLTLATGQTETLGDHALHYAIGSGTRARAFAAEEDGFLVQAPVTWYAAKKGWALSEGYDVAVHPGFTQPLDERCVTCHVGRFEIEEKSLNRVKVLEAAVGCESCHGPGALHAEFRRGPDAPPEDSKAPDDTIVSLRRMSRSQQMDVCAQCHMDPYMTVLHPGKRRQDWRPGMAWDAVQTTFRPSEDSVAPHEFAGHVDALRQSRCFQQSATLTCVTCHGGHRKESAAKRKAHVNAQCVTCHDACARTAAEGEAPVPAADADDCADCHMPRREVPELHLAATRHDIGVHATPRVAPPRPPALGGTVTLLPLQTTKHLSAAVRERNLGLAYLLATTRTPDPLIQRAYAGIALKALEAARATGLEEAELMGALGMFQYTQRIGAKGAAKLLRSLALDAQSPSLAPDTRARMLSTLVDHSFGIRQLEAARGYLEQLIRVRRHPEDWLRIANLHQMEEMADPAAAAAAARKALEILPNEPGIQFRVGDLLGALGFPDEKKRCDRIGEFLHVQHSKRPPK